MFVKISIFLGLIGISIYGCTIMSVNIRFGDIVSKDSEVGRFFETVAQV